MKAPVVFSLLSKEEQIANLIKEEKPTMEYLFDPYVVKILPYAKEHCPIEYSKIKAMAKQAGIGLRDFEKVVKIEAEKQSRSVLDDFAIEPTEICLKGMDAKGAMTPRGYRISDENGVEIVRAEEGVAFCETLCSEPLIISKRTENVDNGTEKYELAYRRNHKWKKIVASRSTVLNKNFPRNTPLPVCCSAETADRNTEELHGREMAKRRLCGGVAID